MKIGWGRREYSAEEPFGIRGQLYLRISEGVADPLYVTALTIDDGDDFVIFTQADITGFAAGILDEVRKGVKAKKPEIDPLKIVLNASHTHSAPMMSEGKETGSWGNMDDIPFDGIEMTPPGEVREHFVNMAVEAICESYENRKEGYISYGYGYAAVAYSRRVVYFDDVSKRVNSNPTVPNGHAMMYGMTKDDNFSHYEAGTDCFANYMFTFDENEKLTGAIINVPCPSQCSENEWTLSADFWGDVREEIQKRYGDIYVLPQCAAAGDLSPHILHYYRAQNRRFKLKFENMKIDERIRYPEKIYQRKDIALRICDSFDEVYSWAQKEKFNNLPVVHSVKTIELDKRIITDEEYEFCLNEIEKRKTLEPFKFDGSPEENLIHNTIILSATKRFENIVKKYEEQKTKPKHETEIHIVKIGNIAFASNQFELYLDYQHRIQGRSPFEQTFIVQLCAQPGNKASGSYLPTQRGEENKGYSASMYCNIVCAKGGQQLVEETVKELKNIY